MVTRRKTVFGCAANFLRGKKCVFCGSFKVHRTSRGYVKCLRCDRAKSLTRLRKEITILQGFYQQARYARRRRLIIGNHREYLLRPVYRLTKVCLTCNNWKFYSVWHITTCNHWGYLLHLTYYAAMNGLEWTRMTKSTFSTTPFIWSR